MWVRLGVTTSQLGPDSDWLDVSSPQVSLLCMGPYSGRGRASDWPLTSSDLSFAATGKSHGVAGAK